MIPNPEAGPLKDRLRSEVCVGELGICSGARVSDSSKVEPARLLLAPPAEGGSPGGGGGTLVLRRDGRGGGAIPPTSPPAPIPR